MIINYIHENYTLSLLDLGLFKQQLGLEDKRLVEKEGTIHLLEGILGVKPKLTYDAFRKPYIELPNAPHLSISHSFDRLAVMTHQHLSIGIDIEKIRDKVIAIRHKFLSTPELTFCGTNATLLTLYWAAKEAAYKAYGKKNLDFVAHIFVKPPRPNLQDLTVEINAPTCERIYQLQYKKLDDYILVYVVNEE